MAGYLIESWDSGMNSSHDQLVGKWSLSTAPSGSKNAHTLLTNASGEEAGKVAS